jgi:hypothetical protein
MHDEYDPVQRIMTKALNITQGTGKSEGKQFDVTFILDDKKSEGLVKGLSLDEFFTKYTSEDTSAFLQIQEKEQKKLRERIEWMFSHANQANQLNQLAINNGGRGGLMEVQCAKTKAIEPDQKQLAIGYSKGEGKVSNSQAVIVKQDQGRTELVRAPLMQI